MNIHSARHAFTNLCKERSKLNLVLKENCYNNIFDRNWMLTTLLEELKENIFFTLKFSVALLSLFLFSLPSHSLPE